MVSMETEISFFEKKISSEKIALKLPKKIDYYFFF
jgi:hypothetical protein